MKLVLTPEDYERLQRSEVWLVGSGGIGRNLALCLAGSMVGRLVLIDGDHVERRNIPVAGFELNDVGIPKVVATKRAIARRFGSKVRVLAIPKFSHQLSDELLAKPDVLVVGVDDIQTRIGIAAIRKDAGKTTVFLGFSGFQGSYLLTVPGITACWACVGRPNDEAVSRVVAALKREGLCPPPEKTNPSPILPATVMKLIGVAAIEVLKLILDKGPRLQYYCFDIMEGWEEGRFLDSNNFLKPDPTCPICNPPRGRDIAEILGERNNAVGEKP